jgi:uncharacterized Zn finger protein
MPEVVTMECEQCGASVEMHATQPMPGGSPIASIVAVHACGDCADVLDYTVSREDGTTARVQIAVVDADE